MRKVAVSSLKEGMAFDKPVYIDNENMLIDALEPLSANDIERLTKWNIKEVETDGEPAEPKEAEEFEELSPEENEDIIIFKGELVQAAGAHEKVEKLFNNGVKLLNDAFQNIAEEKPYQISLVRNFAEDIAALLHDNPQVIIHLYYIEEEDYFIKHVIIGAFFGALLAQEVGFSQPKIIEVTFAMLVMDVGMVLLSDSVRNKEGKLNPNELAQLHTHTLRGYQLLTQNAKVKNTIAEVALQHQEHYDGSGYPRHAKGEEISEYARVAAIADSFTALLEEKAYRSGKQPYEAMKELLSLGIYYYDPNYMRAFLSRLSIYPIGSLVELSDKSQGIVAGAVKDKPMRPVICIIRSPKGNMPEKLHFVHLLYHPEIYITKAIDVSEENYKMEKIFEYIVESQ